MDGAFISTATDGDTTFGSTRTFLCNGAKFLDGANSITCESTGQWSNDVPRCGMEIFVKLSRVLGISHCVELAHGRIGVINKIGVDRKQFVFMLQQLSIIMKIQSCVRMMIECRLGLSQNCWFVRIVRVVPV